MGPRAPMLLFLSPTQGPEMNGHESLVWVLGQSRRLLERHVVWLSAAAADAVTLWVAHTYAVDAFDSTPRLVFRSAEKQSGKTRAQEVIECLVKDPLPSANASVPAIYRSLVDRQPTILLDEYDTYFGSKNAREHADDLTAPNLTIDADGGDGEDMAPGRQAPGFESWEGT